MTFPMYIGIWVSVFLESGNFDLRFDARARFLRDFVYSTFSLSKFHRVDFDVLAKKPNVYVIYSVALYKILLRRFCELIIELGNL